MGRPQQSQAHMCGASIAGRKPIITAIVPLLVFAASFAAQYAKAGSPSAERGSDRRVAGHARTRLPTFRRVVVIVLENKEASEVLGNRAAPTFNGLAGRYAFLASYFGIAHPSLPNYLALVSGSTHGVTSDCTTCTVGGRNLADALDDAGKSWKTYAEGLPAPGFTGAFSGRYAKKHNPFLYFRNVLSSPSRLHRIVPLSSIARDLARRKLPDFSLVVPDLCHDMHDCSVRTGDLWLHAFLPPLLKSPQLRDGVVFVVFDEDSMRSAAGGGHVPALVLGPLVRPGSRSQQRLDHYALLRTIEDGMRLPRLGRSASAPTISGIWRAR